MWYSIFRNSLVGPFLYISTLNGDKFMQLVLNGTVSGLMDELPLAVLTHVWFQLDGAPPHHTSAERRWFNADSLTSGLTYRVLLNFSLDPLT
ncbi:hypothetical protein AVEN_175884-1 [Araneus ventricosus]|uniref:Tc1-like transposase DDE domain-containing protein n=1 Tax=Araneus ventricosus TaxID=182803 RepID=A0A4Y2EEM7_ARAVE|nr:hypothetical protein AVEN_175884-1 [Araneus ventricosus]